MLNRNELISNVIKAIDDDSVDSLLTRGYLLELFGF